MRAPRWWLTLVMLVLAIPLPAAWAQELPAEGVSLVTPFPGVAVAPGNSASFQLTVHAPEGERVALEVTGVPAGWSTSLRGGGLSIREVIVTTESAAAPTLEVMVPPEAAEGDYSIVVIAQGESGSDRLELDVQVAAAVGGGVSLIAEFPALKGASGATFSYTLTLRNDTPEEIQFGLTAEGPEGWLVDAQPAAQARASTVTLGGGEMSLVTATVDPPDNVSAGIYPVRVRASGSGETVTAELTAEITGRYGMDLTTPDDRLNFDIEAGGTHEVRLVLENTGTGGLTAITFTAQPPAGWTVRFSPDFLDLVGPGESAPITALVTAADDAVAGDYVLGMETESNEASDTVEFRAAVKTSAAWGLVGLIVIIVALSGLAVVFWRFGRR